MIKIFGKIRYHWQPELSWSIIYWSLALIPALAGFILLLEKLKISLLILALIGLSLIMIAVGLHRYFSIKEDTLYIADANPFKDCKIPISSIEKIAVTYLSIAFYTKEWPEGKIYYMRKWPKKYFVNTLAINPYFQGEVELTDHLIQQDYFETYYAQNSRANPIK
ncbi:EbsA protein [Streptococcus sp. X16XC17]|uniref:EbsA family protein n=1 Tax=unclassified Streptococcus TaxID=2608887 RepID=UPI00066FFED6|nr:MULTISPECIES: EbsA family protein [unclassified Streptococcus]TCD46509.1 EbsA protein [Streptococcus sp. X16XC17]